MSVVFYDGQKGPEIRENLNNLVAIFEEAIASAVGPSGWSPIFSVASDGSRRVLQIVDWIGGEGTKPSTTGYIGSSGIVADIALAIDIRGPIGATGPSNSLSIGTVTQGAATATITGTSPFQVLNLVIPKGDNGVDGTDGTDGADGTDGTDGWSPILAVVSDSARRVLQIVDWVGGEGTKPSTGYIGPSGIVALIGNAVDIRGPAGSAGSVTWGDITGMPAVIAAGATATEAKTAISLQNVNNTSDLDKPISTATQTALNAKAPLTGAGASGNWNINAATATKLATAITINGISFDGSASISVPVDWASVTGKPVVIAAGNTQASARAAIGAGTGNSNLVIGTTAGTALEGNTAFKTINGNSIKGTGDITISGSTYETGDYRESYANILSGYIRLPASNDIQIVAQNSYPDLTSAIPTNTYTKGTAILKRTASAISTTNSIATVSDNAGNWVHCLNSTQIVYSTDNGDTWSSAVTTGATTRTADAAALNTSPVFWAGDRFVIVPASGMVMYYAFPASLSTWTAMTTAGLTGSINSALWDGTNIIVSSQSNSTNIAYSSDGGASWTSQATGLGSSRHILIGRPGLLIAIRSNSFDSRYSTNSGVSWSASSVTIPGSVGLGNLVGDRYWSYNSEGRIGILVTAASTAEFIYTDNGSSFSSVTLPVGLQGGTTTAIVNNTTNTWFALRNGTYTYSTDNGASWATAASTGISSGYATYMDGVFYTTVNGNVGVFCADIDNGMFGSSGGTTITNFPAPLFSEVVQSLFGTSRVVATGSVLLVISTTNIYAVKSTDVLKKALAIPYKTPSAVTGNVTLNVFIKT